MLAEQILNTDIEPLHGHESITSALNRMKEADVNCLPVVEETTKKLIGQVKQSQLERVEDPEAEVKTFEFDEPVKVFQRQHIFEAARLMLQYELQMVPVVDEEITFVGMITKQNLLQTLPDMLNLVSNGSILTIELDKIDFTLSEIVHLIEVEGAKILGLTVQKPKEEGDTFKISVKLNLKDASRVTSSLRRHDYNVVTDDASRDVFGFDMENRADELLKYIDM